MKKLKKNLKNKKNKKKKECLRKEIRRKNSKLRKN